MSVFNPSTPATIVPKRSIGPFTATVTIEEIASDDLEITQHPVQQGAAITDHAYLKPASISIKFMFNDADMPLSETYAKLRELQASREPFDVVTGKRSYKNMLFKSLSQTNDLYTENVLSISADLQEVLIVQIETTSVPPRSRHANPAKTGAIENAGQKSAQLPQQSQSTTNKSAIVTLVGG